MKKHCRRKDVATVRELLRRGIWPANVPVPDIVVLSDARTGLDGA